MRALLITEGGIKEVELPDNGDSSDHLQAMYDHIGRRTVEGVGYIGQTHAAWGDEEALFTQEATIASFVDWWTGPLVGKILITGFDLETGETTPATMTVKELRQHVIQTVPVMPKD